MAAKVAHPKNVGDARALVRHLHMLVIRGPWDLDVAHAMSFYGYDEVKWAEGQTVLAELVSSDRPGDSCLEAARRWYDEAATVARRALEANPQLLAKIGVAEAAPS
jgi:hypothetical protein